MFDVVMSVLLIHIAASGLISGHTIHAAHKLEGKGQIQIIGVPGALPSTGSSVGSRPPPSGAGSWWQSRCLCIEQGRECTCSVGWIYRERERERQT